MFLGPLWTGYAMSKLWAWHIAGWNGLPPVTYKMMVAVDFIVSMILGARGLPDRSKTPEDDKNFVGGVLATTVFLPALALLIGWILK